MLVALLLSSAIVIQRVLNGYDSISYYWVFREDELGLLKYLNQVYGGVVVGDTKVQYLARYVGIDVKHVCRYTSIPRRVPVFLYAENLMYGFLTSLVSVDMGSIMYSEGKSFDRIAMSRNVVVLWAE